jgi:DnaK suppressor protein
MLEPDLRRIELRLLQERARGIRRLNRFDGEAGHVTDEKLLAAADGSAPGAAEELAKAIFLADRERRYLWRIHEALLRLRRDPDAFGKCRRCGEEISFERLYALPHARFCLACKRVEEGTDSSTGRPSRRRWAAVDRHARPVARHGR